VLVVVVAVVVVVVIKLIVSLMKMAPSDLVTSSVRRQNVG
jgi:hypothetical protein